MIDDVVERAASVARERFDGHSSRAWGTEARVMAALGQRARRRRWLPLIAVPLLFAVLTATAWGKVAQSLRAMLRSLTMNGVQFSKDRPTTATRQLAGARLAIRQQQPAVTPSPAAGAPPPSKVESPSTAATLLPSEPEVRGTTMARRSTQSTAPAQPGGVRVTMDPSRSPANVAAIADLYRAAHRAQFSGAEPARALELWDQYLAAAPNGALSPEARYNRAIDLFRLGRKAEASAALLPFARGDYGSYRKGEARALRDALGAQALAQ